MDSLQPIGTLLLVTFLGLLVAFNPTLIVVDILLVLKTKRPILNTIILASGFVSAVSIMFLVASQLVDPDSQVSLRQLNRDLNIPPFIDILAGSLLLAYTGSRFLEPEVATPDRKTAQFKIPHRPHHLFGFAFLKAILSITNIFAVLILAKLATTHQWNTGRGFLAVLWLLLVGIIPLATIAYYRMFKHQSLKKVDAKINSWLSRDIGRLITYALAATGAFFVIEGTVNLIRG